MASWQGTDYNERLFNGVRNSLVAIYLDGVKGVSPDRGYAWKMVSPEEADRYIAKARMVYVKLVDQQAPRASKGWLDRKIKELDGLIAKAVAVRDGQTPQKMTTADYEALQKHLGTGRTHAHATVGTTTIWKRVDSKAPGALEPFKVDWKLVREASADEVDLWLEIFRRDEPGTVFVVAPTKPRGKKGPKIFKGPGSEY